MSSNSVEGEGCGKRWPRPFRSWSIAARLSMLYTLMAIMILLLTNAFLYWKMLGELNEYSDHYISDEISELRATLLKPGCERIVAREMEHAQKDREYIKHYIRVLDKDGRTLMENQGMDRLVPAAAFPRPDPVYITHGKRIQWQAQNGNSYILKALQTQINGFGGQGRGLQVAMDVTELELFLADYRRHLVTSLILGVLVSVLAGIAVARRGLLPLAKITETIGHITANHLDERVVPQRWPRELTSLAVAFDDMLDRLERSFNALSDYTGNLAHELRTPLNNLMVEADIALSRARTLDEYQKVIGSNMEEYARLSRMIESLLFLARVDNARSGLTLAALDARQEIEDICEFYGAVANDEGITIRCQGGASLSADPLLFRRVISNLLTNALTYTPRGGEIVIAARQEDDLSAEIAVSDTGCGVEPEQLARIFERFYRVGSTRRKNPQGAGLGLAIVKSIMDIHHGTVEARSVPGKGALFLLKFPHEPADGGAAPV